VTTTPQNTPELVRFWSKVTTGLPNACWIWTGGTNNDGYGRFHSDTGHIQAHRFVYELVYGLSTAPSILHRCDNPPCVNPTHLFEGNQLSNMEDMARKERGSGNKVSKDDVVRIRSLVAQGKSQAEVGRLFGVTQGCIGQIWLRRSWAWVK
jgi:hypothetical protein